MVEVWKKARRRMAGILVVEITTTMGICRFWTRRRNSCDVDLPLENSLAGCLRAVELQPVSGRHAVIALRMVMLSVVNDDVRRAAIWIVRAPKQCPSFVFYPTKSYNPHFRYGAVMDLGVAWAGTELRKAIALPLRTDTEVGHGSISPPGCPHRTWFWFSKPVQIQIRELYSILNVGKIRLSQRLKKLFSRLFDAFSARVM